MNQQAFVLQLCEPGELGDGWLGFARRRAARAAADGDYSPIYNARRDCLLLALDCWREGDDAKTLKAKTREAWKRRYAKRYGSVVLAFLLMTVIGAALSWAVQRLLDRWFPNHSAVETTALQQSWRQAAGVR